MSCDSGVPGWWAQSSTPSSSTVATIGAAVIAGAAAASTSAMTSAVTDGRRSPRWSLANTIGPLAVGAAVAQDVALPGPVADPSDLGPGPTPPDGGLEHGADVGRVSEPDELAEVGIEGRDLDAQAELGHCGREPVERLGHLPAAGLVLQAVVSLAEGGLGVRRARTR